MKKIVYLGIVLLFLSACGVKYQTIPYFTDLPADSSLQEKIQNQTALRIQKGDILGLTVTSLNPEASIIYNRGNTSSVQGGGAGSSDPVLTSNGFVVDQRGNIQMQSIGDVKVEGLTTVQARAIIEEKLTKFLKEPVVSLKIVNFRISVMGDVLRPGVYSVNNEQVSVSEALSMAGDLNITAERKNVLLVREVNGERQFVRLDLQSKALFNSPYYYLQNNDVLYIQPGKTKYASVDASYRNVSIVLSALSVIAILISRF